jgi:nucleoside-diphosphate-sugar epimerase
MQSSSKQFTVLGARGFIGAQLVSHLEANGHVVYAPERGDTQVFQRKLGHVLYCIGLTADFRTRPFDTVRAHVSVLAEVLEKAEFNSLVYLSSTRVYARSASGKESAPLTADVSDPSDLYNLTKLTGESLCRSCNRPNVKVARLSNVIGLDHQSDNFLFALIREAISGRIELQSDPESAKDYILLDDVVALLPRIAVEGKGWLYNIASGSNVAHREIVALLALLTRCEVAVRPDAPLSVFPEIDIGQLRKEFNFSPLSLLGYIPDLVEKFRQPS